MDQIIQAEGLRRTGGTGFASSFAAGMWAIAARARRLEIVT
jgi:hypothetical protein